MLIVHAINMPLEHVAISVFIIDRRFDSVITCADDGLVELPLAQTARMSHMRQTYLREIPKTMLKVLSIQMSRMISSISAVLVTLCDYRQTQPQQLQAM